MRHPRCWFSIPSRRSQQVSQLVPASHTVSRSTHRCRLQPSRAPPFSHRGTTLDGCSKTDGRSPAPRLTGCSKTDGRSPHPASPVATSVQHGRRHRSIAPHEFQHRALPVPACGRHDRITRFPPPRGVLVAIAAPAVAREKGRGTGEHDHGWGKGGRFVLVIAGRGCCYLEQPEIIPRRAPRRYTTWVSLAAG